jgi:hypothetical protein
MKFNNSKFLAEYSIDNFDTLKAYYYFTKYTALKRGNKKLGKNILNFNLPPVKSCMNSEDCAKDCYAVKSYRLYPTVKNYQDIMQFFALNDTETLENKIISEIEDNLNKKWFSKVIRIHSSGDFISQEYLNMWVNIAAKFKDVKFYGFTKVDHILNFDNLPTNLNIISSYVNNQLNFGSLDYVKKLRAESKGIICPPTRGKDLTCETCKYCFTKDKPIFVQH